MQALIERFQATAPETAPFELRSGAEVIDPAKFHAAILSEIELGPAGARAMMGGLEGDLRDYFSRFPEKKD